MKYMVSSEEKPQNFPIYAVHSDIDSYILFNDNSGHINEDETKEIRQAEDKNELAAQEIKPIQSSEEIVPKKKPNKKPQLQLTNFAHRENINSPWKQELLWFVEFDGSVNKLGAACSFLSSVCLISLVSSSFI